MRKKVKFSEVKGSSIIWKKRSPVGNETWWTTEKYRKGEEERRRGGKILANE